MILRTSHFALILLAFFLMQAAQGYAADTKIAVVDIEKILNESAAGKSIQTQLTQQRESFQKEFSARENNLMEAEKTLIQQKSNLSAEEFDKKRKAFETQLLETRNLFQKRRNSLDKGLGNALSSLRRNIIEVTAEISDAEDFQIVLTRDSVVIVQKQMDITDQVLNALNAKIATIKLDVEG